jgi:hypothetical protein
MNKIKWGRNIWKTIHYVAIGYPSNPTSNDKINYKNFYISLSNVLPCKICQEHYKDNLLKLPLTNEVLMNNNNLLKWTIDLHNLINEQLGYPIISYDKALNEIYSYEEIKYDYIKIILIIFFIFLLIKYIIKYFRK